MMMEICIIHRHFEEKVINEQLQSEIGLLKLNQQLKLQPKPCSAWQSPQMFDTEYLTRGD